MKSVLKILACALLIITSCNIKSKSNYNDEQFKHAVTFIDHIRKHEYDAAKEMTKKDPPDPIITTEKAIMDISGLIDKDLLVSPDKWIERDDTFKHKAGNNVVYRSIFIFVKQHKEPNPPYCLDLSFSLSDKDMFPTTISNIYISFTKRNFDSFFGYNYQNNY